MPVKRTTTPKPARKPAARRAKKAPAVSQEQIATRAYFLHLEGGADEVENWLRAERELVAS